MNIVICEDNSDYRLYINEVLSKYIKKKKSNARIVLCTDNPADVLDYVKHNSEITIYYLDIMLSDDSSGIDIASAVRAKDYTSHIIFVTSHGDFMPLTYEYKLEALDYIVKHDSSDVEEKLCDGLNYAESRETIGYEKHFTIHNKQKNFSLPMNDICYIESIKSSHKLVLYHTQGMITFYGLLKDIEKQLDENFIRCHKSVIVNRQKIIDIDKQNYILGLENGYQCIYSKKCKEITRI